MDHRYLHHQREHPSFSSTLLDAIYRSIDESNGEGEEELIFYRETMRKKHNNNTNGFKAEERKTTSLKKACMIEKWMEEKVSYEKVASVRRKSMADDHHHFEKNTTTRKDFNHPVLLNSSSSSSESSCGGGFSSSESESVYGLSYTVQRPKPIRTSVSSARPPVDEIGMYHYNHHDRKYAPTQKPNSKHEAAATASSFVKTKSKALKIYGDLKKVKQPISPGGRLASFINSLFTAGNAKKAKISSSSVSGYDQERKLKSEQTSTCSSASSFSRSCLSKTPSSRGNGAKRSVRFYPVSVIVDEDSKPCGHKNLYGIDQEINNISTTRKLQPSNEELKFHILNESRRVEEVARDLLKNYQKKKQEEFDEICNANARRRYSDQEQEDENEDAASCASSDLFELDNLSAIGIERYREELPVYETTHLNTNRAIANGLIL